MFLEPRHTERGVSGLTRDSLMTALLMQWMVVTYLFPFIESKMSWGKRLSTAL